MVEEEDEDEDEEERRRRVRRERRRRKRRRVVDEVVTCLNCDSDCDTSDDSELEGATPTKKVRKLASNIGFQKAMHLSSYPSYSEDTHGPFVSMDPDNNDPHDFLKLLWPDHLVDLLVRETNNYALRKGVRDWKDVDRRDIWTFLGIIVIMGIKRLPRIENYWSRDSLLGVPEVSGCMSLNRFWAIWTCLHVVDDQEPSSGNASITSKIKPLLDILEDTFFINYSPAQEMCVDEAMIKFKGRVKKGKVKMPKKPVKEGFKVWCACCACCGYLCAFQVYEGKPEVRESGVIKKVVLDLMAPFQGMNHVVYLDNYFTSGPLVDELAKVKTYTVGTIQQGASGFPQALKTTEIPPNGYAAQRVENTSYYAFQDRKLVSFVSNIFPLEMKGRVARLPPKGRVLKHQQVPPVLPVYNRYMGAVDRLSQVRRTYGYNRKSKRYWLRLFMTFFDYAVNNSFILYKHNCKTFSVKSVELLEFRLELARLLLKDTRIRRGRESARDGDSPSPCHLVRVSDVNLQRGRCYHCVKVKRRPMRYTSFGCSNCGVRLCKTTCFAEFHKDF